MTTFEIRTPPPHINLPQTPEKKPTPPDSALWMDGAKAFILIGLSLYFAYNIVAGNLPNYINMRFAWLSYLAVGMFAILGGITLIGVLRQDDASRTSDHTLVTWPIILIVSLPLLLGTLIPSRPLGSSAVRGNLSFTTASLGAVQVATKDPLDRNVLDWAVAFSQSGATPNKFDGQEARFIGFVVIEPTYPDGYVIVARSVVRCCVVDMEGLGIPVYWPHNDLQNDQWVQVRGTFQAGTFQDKLTPILQVESLEIIPAPEQAYLYP